MIIYFVTLVKYQNEVFFYLSKLQREIFPRLEEQEDPVTWHALKNGDFGVAKSEVPFIKILVEQT